MSEMGDDVTNIDWDKSTDVDASNKKKPKYNDYYHDNGHLRFDEDGSLASKEPKPLSKQPMPRKMPNPVMRGPANQMMRKKAKRVTSATAEELERRKNYIGGALIGEKTPEKIREERHRAEADKRSQVSLGASLVNKVHNANPEMESTLDVGQVAGAVSGNVLDISRLIASMRREGLLDAQQPSTQHEQSTEMGE